MASKVEQSPWMAEGEDKRSAIQGMFSEIAPTYDLLNSVMSLRLHRRWRATAVEALRLSPGSHVLDVCCGTGDFLVPLRKAVGASGEVVGVDFAQPMLERAKSKVDCDLVLGDAGNLPFQKQSFDGITVGWGLRNVPSIDASLKEIVRVLKPGGTFVCLEMSRPKGIVGWLSEKVFHFAVPVLGALFGKPKAYTYLPKSTAKFVTPDRLTELMTAVGLRGVSYRTFFFGNVCLHTGTKP